MPSDFANACFESEDAESGRESGSRWAPFLAAVIWIFVPLTLAVLVADARDQSVVIAVVLTLILGWIGFVIVYSFLGRRDRDRVAPRSGA